MFFVVAFSGYVAQAQNDAAQLALSTPTAPPLNYSVSAAKEGQAKPPNAAILIPVGDVFTILQRGADAEIKQGATYTALIAEDATLTPAID
jgi:hypothetical protein